MGKKGNSVALLLSAVFGIRWHVDYRMVFWSKTFYTFQYQPLSEKIISEIIRLWHSSFFSKFSKFHAHFRNGIWNLEKVFRFSDNSVWSGGRIFCILRQEYLSSAVNVLANSLKIYDQSKGVFFLLNLPGIHGKKRIMVMPCYFQRCFEPLNPLITEWCSEARLSRRFSSNLFRKQ